MRTREHCIKLIEKKLNIDNFKDYLYNLYVNELKSIREISKIIYGNCNRTHTINDYLHYFNIPLRHGSEAVKVQYLNGKKEQRVKIILEKVIPVMNNKENREKLINIMQTDEYKNKQRISKLGEKNGMYGVTGEKNPSWNPNKTREQRQKDRKLNENAVWRNQVFKRDDYECQYCKNKGVKLVAHHKDGYHWCIDKRFDVDNGVTLCEKCHKDFHKKYGMKNNTKEQYEEFIQTKS